MLHIRITVSLFVSFVFAASSPYVVLGQALGCTTSDEESNVRDTQPSTEDSFGIGSEKLHDIALRAIDEIIDNLKRMGDSEDVHEWQKYRDQFPIGSEDEAIRDVGGWSCRLAHDLRKRNELQPAEKMIGFALQIADALKAQYPHVFVIAQAEAADIDGDFEQYESAAKRLNAALKVATEESEKRHDLIACRANYAYFLRKLKRFDEAERIYVNLIQKAKENADGLAKDDLYQLQFGLAALYAEKGAFRQYHDALPDGGREHRFED